jgi:hypothetical protein
MMAGGLRVVLGGTEQAGPDALSAVRGHSAGAGVGVGVGVGVGGSCASSKTRLRDFVLRVAPRGEPKSRIWGFGITTLCGVIRS